MPDSWAVKQLFPIMPIHRLDERPTHHAVLGDITCDSDGKVERFIDRRDVKRTLLLHTFDGQPYYLGAFLVGAYQEILGDLHNLFGDTNAVHVSTDAQGNLVIEEVINGDTVREVLGYMQFDADVLDAPDARARGSCRPPETASTSSRRAALCGSTAMVWKATLTSKAGRLSDLRLHSSPTIATLTIAYTGSRHATPDSTSSPWECPPTRCTLHHFSSGPESANRCAGAWAYPAKPRFRHADHNAIQLVCELLFYEILHRLSCLLGSQSPAPCANVLRTAWHSVHIRHNPGNQIRSGRIPDVIFHPGGS